MIVWNYAARLRLTLAIMPPDRGAELAAAIEALGLIALKDTARSASRAVSATRLQ